MLDHFELFSHKTVSGDYFQERTSHVISAWLRRLGLYVFMFNRPCNRVRNAVEIKL